MKIRYIILLFLVAAFTIPASIKTEYTDHVDDRVDLSLHIEPYAGDALLLTWKPEGLADVLAYEIQRLDENGQFVTVGFVPTLRGSKSREFQFIDSPPTSPQHVYRLKKIKTDHSEMFSREEEFLRQPHGVAANE